MREIYWIDDQLVEKRTILSSHKIEYYILFNLRDFKEIYWNVSKLNKCLMGNDEDLIFDFLLLQEG